MVLRLLNNVEFNELSKYGFEFNSDLQCMVRESGLSFYINNDRVIRTSCDSSNGIYDKDLVVIYNLIKDNLVEIRYEKITS